ncbi:uncharacterized protein AB675_11957 [Cyphellophora attinorum]|uniref:Rhodopsin domain-containing protein n=1 Tax=Cyphellophora attinorum TaxID=1664694 RepID=A0A0N1NVG3_9EURO|nr:uncharacterized protein AB675_11957 [Phialophora attinorum]KPI34996.1 hypothetical protein AB675_11957 [Phialophora attinorum]
MPPNPPLPSNADENASGHIIGATVAVSVLALLVTVTRFYVRGFIVRAVGWDDWLMALAMLLVSGLLSSVYKGRQALNSMQSISTEIFIILAVKNGAGQHIGDVSPHQYYEASKFAFIVQDLPLWAICIVKLSVGCALLRIAARDMWKWIIASVMAFMIAYTISAFATTIAFCQPISLPWNPQALLDPANAAKCWPVQTLQDLTIAHAALNIFTDIVFAVGIPIPMLWKLQLNSRTKAAIMFILSLGIFVCVAGVLKIPEIQNFGKQGDFLWSIRKFIIFFQAEVNIGIIAGSLPALKPLFNVLADKTSMTDIFWTTRRNDTVATTYANHIQDSRVASWRQETTRKTSIASVTDPERQDFGDTDAESSISHHSAVSQQNLVMEANGDGQRRNIPMGVIHKSVTTSVTALPEDEEYSGSSPPGPGWAM